MTNKKKKTKQVPDFAQYPNTECPKCKGSGRIVTNYGLFSKTYGQCPMCEGKGRDESECVKCEETLDNRSNFSMVCFNKNCTRFGLLTIAHVKK